MSSLQVSTQIKWIGLAVATTIAGLMLVRRGGFGSPTIYVNGDDMYFGNDRLPLVREALLRGCR